MKALMSAVVIGLSAAAGCDGGDGCFIQGTLVEAALFASSRLSREFTCAR
ncbi:MAG TPA: hypothetical protein VFT13_01935 [Candidatus Krumholzibacteria bacterium]|nr:hypothetical protein [Candidatus Krumholzibacteria bacterium]